MKGEIVGQSFLHAVLYFHIVGLYSQQRTEQPLRLPQWHTELYCVFLLLLLRLPFRFTCKEKNTCNTAYLHVVSRIGKCLYNQHQSGRKTFPVTLSPLTCCSLITSPSLSPSGKCYSKKELVLVYVCVVWVLGTQTKSTCLHGKPLLTKPSPQSLLRILTSITLISINYKSLNGIVWFFLFWTLPESYHIYFWFVNCLILCLQDAFMLMGICSTLTFSTILHSVKSCN